MEFVELVEIDTGKVVDVDTAATRARTSKASEPEKYTRAWFQACGRKGAGHKGRVLTRAESLRIIAIREAKKKLAADGNITFKHYDNEPKYESGNVSIIDGEVIRKGKGIKL